MTQNPDDLPVDLVRPVDDGAADHLPGSLVPPQRLAATDGSILELAERCRARPLVVFAYPRTGRPGTEPLVPEWDQIPGARGCTPQACGFRELAAEFAAENVEVFGLSTQTTEDQREAVKRLRLPYRLLSDAALEWSLALRLPTFHGAGLTLLRRCTLLLAAGQVVRVIYPVFLRTRRRPKRSPWYVPSGSVGLSPHARIADRSITATEIFCQIQLPDHAADLASWVHSADLTMDCQWFC